MAKPNDKIGPYTLISKLGRGAFGVVWLAEKRTQLATTKVALKLPNDEDIDIEAVTSEAAVWVEASGHPNILPIIDADIYDGQAVIVSEYAPDGSLSKWMESHGSKAPSVEVAAEMIDGVLAGLEHLHERRIIHRDLKPDNILLQREIPRLADFGIARILKTSLSTVVSGTPAYMAPEAFDGKRSEQTDIWAVGVIFYQLLTGRLPFPPTDMASLLAAILTRDQEPLPGSISKPIREIISKSLQKNPTERFQSATEMRKALRDAGRSPSEEPSEIETTFPPIPKERLRQTLAPTIPAMIPDAAPTLPAPAPPPVVLQDLLPNAGRSEELGLRPPPAKSNKRLWLILAIILTFFLCYLTQVINSVIHR